MLTAALSGGAAALLAACGGTVSGSATTAATSSASAAVPTTTASASASTLASSATSSQAVISTSTPTTSASATTTTASASSTAAAASPSAAASSVATGKTEITYIDAAPPLDQPSYKQVIQNFEQAHPDVTVSYTSMNYNDFINTAFPSWVAGDTYPDTYIVQGTYAANWSARKWLAQLDDLIKRDAAQVNTDDFWPDQVQSELQYKGHWYVLPWDYGEVGAYLNKDMFQAAGIAMPSKDWTWDDVTSLSQKLTKGPAGQQTQWGFGGYPRTQEFQAYLWSYGGAFLSDDGTTCVVNDPKYADANAASLQYFADLGHKYNVIPADTKQRGQPGFFANKIGIQLDGVWNVANYMTNIANHFAFDAQWWPVTKSTGRRGIFHSGAGYGMSPVTRKRDQAWEWLKAVSSTQGAEIIVADRLRGLPGRKSAIPAWQKATTTIAGAPPNAQVFPDMLTAGYPRQPVVFWTDLSNIADQFLQTIWSGKQQAHEVLAGWQQQMNVAIAKYKELLG